MVRTINCLRIGEEMSNLDPGWQTEESSNLALGNCPGTSTSHKVGRAWLSPSRPTHRFELCSLEQAISLLGEIISNLALGGDTSFGLCSSKSVLLPQNSLLTFRANLTLAMSNIPPHPVKDDENRAAEGLHFKSNSKFVTEPVLGFWPLYFSDVGNPLWPPSCEWRGPITTAIEFALYWQHLLEQVYSFEGLQRKSMERGARIPAGTWLDSKTGIKRTDWVRALEVWEEWLMGMLPAKRLVLLCKCREDERCQLGGGVLFLSLGRTKISEVGNPVKGVV